MKKLLLLPILFLSFAQAETIKYKNCKAVSGDTLECTSKDEQKITLKLSGINAPEPEQPFFENSKESLQYILSNSILSFGKLKKNSSGINTIKITAEIYPIPERCRGYKDYYTYCPETKPRDISYLMIRSGLAWNRKLSITYSKAEKKAREAKRVLWADPNPIPPWEWRKK